MEIATRRVMVRLFGIDPTKNPGDRKLLWPGEIYVQEQAAATEGE